MKFTSQIFVISNRNIWSSCHIFLWSPTESFDLTSQFFALSTRQWTCCWVIIKCFPGGEWHTPPFFLGYQPLHPSSPLILRWFNLCHPLSFWPINHSSFIPLISRWINLLLDDLWHNKVEHVMFAPTHSLGSWVVHHGQFIDQLPPSHGNWGKIVSRMDKGFCHVRLEMQG